MSDSHHDDYWRHDEAPPSVTVTHAVEATEAIRAATYRIQRMQVDVHSLIAVGAALEGITRELAQFAGQVAGALPDSVDQNLAASQEIRDGLVAFRIAVLDASVAARSLGWSATSVGDDVVPRQRRR